LTLPANPASWDASHLGIFNINLSVSRSRQTIRGLKCLIGQKDAKLPIKRLPTRSYWKITCLHPQAASAARHSVDPSRSVPLSTAISLDMDQLIMQKRLGHQKSQWNFRGDGQTQMQPLRYQHIVLQPEINDTRIQAAFLKAEPRPWNLSWRKTWRCFWTKAQNNLSCSCSCSYASDFSIDSVCSLSRTCIWIVLKHHTAIYIWISTRRCKIIQLYTLSIFCLDWCILMLTDGQQPVAWPRQQKPMKAFVGSSKTWTQRLCTT